MLRAHPCTAGAFEEKGKQAIVDPSALPSPPPKRKRSANQIKLPNSGLGSTKATATEGNKSLDPMPQEAATPPVRAPFPVVLDGEEEDEEEGNSLVHRSRRRRINPTHGSPDPHAGATSSKETPESDRQDQTGFGPETPTLNSVPTETSR